MMSGDKQFIAHCWLNMAVADIVLATAHLKGYYG